MLDPRTSDYKTGDVLIGTPAASDEYRVTTEGSVIVFLYPLKNLGGFSARGRFSGWHVGYLGDPSISRKIRDAQELLKTTPLEELSLWTVSIHNLEIGSTRRTYFRPQIKRLKDDIIKYSSRLPDL